MQDKTLPLALLIMRLSIAFFLGLWASLKFYRPEWMENIFKGRYGLDFVTQDLGIYVGVAQLAIVLMFAIGYKRTVFYGLMMAMHTAGVYGAVGGMLNYTKYPNNLLLTAVPTLGALIALFLLRRHDLWTVDGQFGKNTKVAAHS